MPVPKLRFKADDGSDFSDWKKEKFGNFIITHTERTSDKEKYPLYSLTIESGCKFQSIGASIPELAVHLF